MSYRLIHEDEKTFELEHPKTGRFVVAKHGLKPDLIKKIQGMKEPLKMSDGGEVPDLDEEDAGSEPSAPDDAPSVQSPLLDQALQTGQVGVPEGMSAPSAPAVTAAAEGADPKAPDPAAGFTSMGGLDSAFKDEKQGIQGEASAKSKEFQGQAGAYGDFLKSQPTLQNLQNQVAQYEQHRSDIQNEMDGIQKQVSAAKIDPNRVWSNASTGSKIAASLGILLSGIGSGLTGGRNAALDVINQTIDRDIDAQKSDLGKKQNLLTLNMQRYRDLGAATAATKLQMGTVLQAQLAQKAAQSGSQIAQAQAQQAIGHLKLQMAPLQNQLALFRLQSQIYGGGGQGGIPASQEPIAALSKADPKYLDKRIQIGDRAYQAASPDDAKEVRNMQAKYEPVRSAVMQLSSLGPEATIPGSAANLRAQSIRSLLIPQIMQMDGFKRLAKEDINNFGNALKDPTKFREMMNGDVKNQQFIRNLNEDIESTYQTRLIGYRGLKSIHSRQPGWGGNE